MRAQFHRATQRKVEQSWVPSDEDQSIARVWRTTQTHPVSVVKFFLEGSLDERMQAALGSGNSSSVRSMAKTLAKSWDSKHYLLRSGERGSDTGPDALSC